MCTGALNPGPHAFNMSTLPADPFPVLSLPVFPTWPFSSLPFPFPLNPEASREPEEEVPLSCTSHQTRKDSTATEISGPCCSLNHVEERNRPQLKHRGHTSEDAGASVPLTRGGLGCHLWELPLGQVIQAYHGALETEHRGPEPGEQLSGSSRMSVTWVQMLD